MDEFEIVFDAKGCDYHIDGFADRYTVFAQGTKNFCRAISQFFSEKIPVFETFHEVLRGTVVCILAETLQEFGNDEIPGNHAVVKKF